MGNIARDLTELVGRTPLLEASRFSWRRGLSCRLLCKLEYLNPAGSVKDRVALWMLRGAEESGALKPGAHYHRAHLWQYRHWFGGHGCGFGL